MRRSSSSKRSVLPRREYGGGGGGGSWKSPIDELMKKIGEIEKEQKNVCLLFSPYNGEKSGPNFDLLLKLQDYHHQSADMLNFYCIGYDFDSDSTDEEDFILISNHLKNCKAKLFLHRQFHEIRREVYTKLRGKVGYTGGIELFIFPLTSGKKQVDWTNSVLFSSAKLTPDVFRSADEMIRYVFELSHFYKGEFLSNEAQKDLRDKILKQRLLKFSKHAVGPTATLLASMISST